MFWFTGLPKDLGINFKKLCAYFNWYCFDLFVTVWRIKSSLNIIIQRKLYFDKRDDSRDRNDISKTFVIFFFLSKSIINHKSRRHLHPLFNTTTTEKKRKGHPRKLSYEKPNHDKVRNVAKIIYGMRNLSDRFECRIFTDVK